VAQLVPSFFFRWLVKERRRRRRRYGDGCVATEEEKVKWPTKPVRDEFQD
jgi:hypothetical protein